MRRAVACLGGLSFVSSKIFFSETFGDGWESRWTTSKLKESEGTAGTWVPTAGKWFKNEKEDTGIQTSQNSKFFGISASFDSFSNEGKNLVIQYQVKYEQDIFCGGGYIKVGPKMEDATKFGDPTPYHIMFGPDSCGESMKTHLIFTYKGKNVLKTSNLPYKQEIGLSHLYRMILKPDNTVRVEIDEEKIYEGSLKEDWELLPPKELFDPDDKKPDDWVEEAMIDDPADKKPDDWVEEQRIVDAEAKKPDEWDDEEDGEWLLPMKDNPAYKGEWFAKSISNPTYKGIWEPKKLANPEYTDDDMLYKFEDIGFVGVDVWQVKGGAIFDNFIITDDVAEADFFAKKWKALNEVEAAKMIQEQKSKKTKKKKKDEKSDDDDDEKDEKRYSEDL